MIFSLYIHQDIEDVLTTFGKLDDVINKILQASSDGLIDIFDKPKCRDRQGAKRIEVNITNEDYLETLSYFPPNSSHISLRRIIYWFVENEVYEQLNWKPVTKFIDTKKERMTKDFTSCKELLQKLRIKYKEYELDLNKGIELVNSIIRSINGIQET